MTLRLTRLDARMPIANTDGTPTLQFLRLFNKNQDSIESNDAAQQDAIEAIAAAQAAANAANAAAEAAQAAADSVTAANGIADSFVKGLVLEAFNDGADCHVDISDHIRVYADGTEVPVDGGTLSAIPHDTVVRVYYDDPDREGGAVSYFRTEDITVAVQAGDRHVVGATVTPRAAEMDTVIGMPMLPPGAIIP